MADGGGDDILSRKKEFLDSFFKKGAEFTEEILRENEKLRFRALELEEQLAAAARAISTRVTVQELQDRVEALERERGELTEKFKRVEAESRAYLERPARIEHENHNLANLYVAAYQLHSTFDLREVLQQVVEILLNFVGAKRFAVLLWDDEAGRLRAAGPPGAAR